MRISVVAFTQMKKYHNQSPGEGSLSLSCTLGSGGNEERVQLQLVFKCA